MHKKYIINQAIVHVYEQMLTLELGECNDEDTDLWLILIDHPAVIARNNKYKAKNESLSVYCNHQIRWEEYCPQCGA